MVKSIGFLGGVAFMALLIDSATVARAQGDFVRGDTNFDGTVSISDAATTSRYLFVGGGGPIVQCGDAGDVNDDGVIDVSDTIETLLTLFLSGPIFPEPFPLAGQDQTDDRSDCADLEVSAPETDERFIFEVGEVSGGAGEVVTVPVYATTPVEVDAFSLSIAFDPDVVEVLEVVGEGTVYEEPEFFNLVLVLAGESGFPSTHGFWGGTIDGENGRLVHGVMHTIAGDIRLTPLERKVIANLKVKILESAGEGVTEITPVNGLTDPPIFNEYSILGEAVYAATYPKLVGGKINLGTPTNIDIFRRGDANGDGLLDSSDAIYTLGYLFLGGATPECLAAVDANDSGDIDVSDPVSILLLLFRDSLSGLPPPFPDCGADPSKDLLTCESYDC